MKRVLFGVLCSLALISVPLGAVQAKKAEEEKGKVNRKERIEYVNEQIKKLGGKGNDAVEEWLLENGFVKFKKGKQSSNSEISPLSSNGMIDLDVDTYYDTLTNAYCLKGTWEWKDEQYPDSDEGPEEVLALVMSDDDGDPIDGHEWEDAEIE